MNYILGTAGQRVTMRTGPGEWRGSGRGGSNAQQAARGPAPAPTPESAPAAAPIAPLSVQGLPLIKPPYGTISAINPDRGEIVDSGARRDSGMPFA